LFIFKAADIMTQVSGERTLHELHPKPTAAASQAGDIAIPLPMAHGQNWPQPLSAAF
jgi:hypothetical protein